MWESISRKFAEIAAALRSIKSGKRKRSKKTRKSQSDPLPEDPSFPSPAQDMAHRRGGRTDAALFRFPTASSAVLPDPGRFFAPSLLAGPLPTNSFFQNFVLKNGDQPEYIHPYLIKSSGSGVTVCSPTRFHTPNFIYQTFVGDITVAARSAGGGGVNSHVISAFDDLSVTLDIPPALRFYLARGSPFVTFEAVEDYGPVDLQLSSVHAFLSVDAADGRAGCKYKLAMNSGQTFLLYSSSAVEIVKDSLSSLSISGFSGVMRIAYLPADECEAVLDQFSRAYPVSGEAALHRHFCVEYNWVKRGWGELIMLAHPLHLQLLTDERRVTVLPEFRYQSIDGDLVGVVGNSWVLRADPVSPTWYSIGGVDPAGVEEIIDALRKDVGALAGYKIATPSSYFYGKAIARVARFALIGEEVGCLDIIPAVREFLKAAVTPWLDGSFDGNGFLYDTKWGGMVTKLGLTDYGADFGFGIYNDHHYHLGYFLYAIAVLAKIDSVWGRSYMPQAYAMVADFMTVSRRCDASYTRLRMFDLWTLHSWAGGLTEFADGRNEESTSEAVNAYYSAALVGLAYGDTHLVGTGSTLLALEMLAAQTWWHVREGGGMYEEEFCRQNKVVGVLWANKRDSGLWFAPPEWKECRLGIQLLPVLPVTEYLFPDVGFVRELVEWAAPALEREGVGEGWKGFVYALEGVYDKDAALAKTRALTWFDDGNSLSNALWWLHSRAESVQWTADGGGGWARCCWYRNYCR